MRVTIEIDEVKCTVVSKDNDTQFAELVILIKQCCAGIGYSENTINEYMGEG